MNCVSSCLGWDLRFSCVSSYEFSYVFLLFCFLLDSQQSIILKRDSDSQNKYEPFLVYFLLQHIRMKQTYTFCLHTAIIDNWSFLKAWVNKWVYLSCNYTEFSAMDARFCINFFSIAKPQKFLKKEVIGKSQ